MSDDYKAQRDRYMAFSLAAADLLVEVDQRHRIVRTVGATQALLNENSGDIQGRNVCELFAMSDRSFAGRLLGRARKDGRVEPCRLQLDQGTDAPPLPVNVGVCFLPNQDGHIYVSLTVMARAAPAGATVDAATGLLDADGYKAMAQQALESGAGAPREMKMVRLKGLGHAVRNLPSAQAEMMMGEIGAVLRAQSAGGQSAARLSDEEFSYLPPARGNTATPESLVRDFKAVAVAAGLAENSFIPTVMSLELSTGNLDSDSVARALSHAISNFCKPENAPLKSLEEGLQSAMAETVKHFDSIRNLLEGRNFTLFYQPVVLLSDRSVHHYEALIRFRDGRSPFETIRLSEELGLVADFDLAAAREAIALLNQRDDVSIAVNVSGLSVQNEAFRENLRQLVLPHRDLQGRLLFELTESAEIVDLDAAGTFLRWLRRTGFQVCLDDFGAGAAAYAYLRQFDVDFVKIDGPFLKEARDNPRQRALVRSVSHLCKDLQSEVVAEMIEDESMAKLCVEMGITYGQGYLFGKPKAQIEMPRELVVGKRKGFIDSWG